MSSRHAVFGVVAVLFAGCAVDQRVPTGFEMRAPLFVAAAAHIHCAPAGANGPIRMWLHPVIGPTGMQGPNGSGPHDGVLASGTFSPTGVVCPASAVGQDMPLLGAMRAGLTYVNVHTNDGVTPTNMGPATFRGVRSAGSSITRAATDYSGPAPGTARRLALRPRTAQDSSRSCPSARRKARSQAAGMLSRGEYGPGT